MKKLFVLFSLLLLSKSFLLAQNYNIVVNGRTYFYDKNGQILAVRADSVISLAGDSLFYHFNMYRDTVEQTQGCVDVYGGSLLGKKNILSQDGKFKIITFRNDTVVLLPYALLDETWIMYHLVNGSYLEAKITDISNQVVLGDTEEVKTISITAMDAQGDTISHPFNQKHLLLSASHGLLLTYDFFMFPTDTTLCNLKGTDNPLSGEILPLKSFFDFNINDEFHLVEKSLQYIHNGTWYINSGFIKSTIKTVISKNVSQPDTSITYCYSLCTRIVNYTNSLPDTVATMDTITETISLISFPDTTFRQLPLQTFYTQGSMYNLPLVREYNYNLYNNRYSRVHCEWEPVGYNSCWQYLPVDPGPQEYKYIEGCGGPYTYFADWMGYVYDYNLVYFKKGNETWGNPVATDCVSLLTSTNFANADIFINVYPNPAIDIIHIQTSGKKALNAEVFNIYGSLILTSKTTDVIDISNLSKGIYLIKINFNDTYVMRKIIKN